MIWVTLRNGDKALAFPGSFEIVRPSAGCEIGSRSVIQFMSGNVAYVRETVEEVRTLVEVQSSTDS